MLEKVMSSFGDKSHVFSGLKALKSDASSDDRDQLFRNMGQLFAHVSNYCNDSQVSQYDEVLCNLAELVEVEARAHVANLLAPLERAPGSVVLHLAQDDILVARPLLEFSNVLSDDDLIEIIENKSEDHRTIIAGRNNVTFRVGDAIADNGGHVSLTRLIENESANISNYTLEKAVILASDNNKLAERLRNRNNVDWQLLRKEIGAAGAKVLAQLSLSETEDESGAKKISDVVYNRIRNQAGFSASEWKVAFNQVKALNDRRQLNTITLARFVRFGYGHHIAAAITIMMNIPPQTFVKWLASQDYVGVSVVCKKFDLSNELFEDIITQLPWRDIPERSEICNVCKRYEKLTKKEASSILKLWLEKAANLRCMAKAN